jgi:hypothetical protein
MIVITVRGTDHKFRYEGRVELYINDIGSKSHGEPVGDMLHVHAQRTVTDPDSLTTWGGETWDLFWPDEIVSIEGI